MSVPVARQSCKTRNQCRRFSNNVEWVRVRSARCVQETAIRAHAASGTELAGEAIMNLILGGVIALVAFYLAGIRIVRPTGRGLVERFGKYHGLAMPGSTGCCRWSIGCSW
jgi:hypothetical protein